MVEGLSENPRDSVNWRRHRSGCPNFRMRWYPHSNQERGEPLYQVYCLMNTPPQTFDEQERCLNSKTRCWRIRAEAAHQEDEAKISLASIKRRKPA